MAVRFYMDVHVPYAITKQLRLREVDVLTAQDDGATELSDNDLLDRATSMSRILFTHDVRFRAMAEQWIREGRRFGGLAFGPMRGASVGQYVLDLHLIANVTENNEWVNRVEFLPF